MHRNGRQNATGTVVYDQRQHLCKPVDDSCLLQARSVVIWSLIKHKYRLRKRKANMASNIHSHQHLMPSDPRPCPRGWGHAEIWDPRWKWSFLTSDFPSTLITDYRAGQQLSVSWVSRFADGREDFLEVMSLSLGHGLRLTTVPRSTQPCNKLHLFWVAKSSTSFGCG